jgi:copper transport protein
MSLSLPRGVNRQVFAAMLLAAFGAPSAALAHPTLVSSNPANGATLAASPAELVLVFSKSVQADLSSITLAGPAGTPVVVLGRPTQPAGSGKVLVARVPRVLAPGKYLVTWRAAGNDGHAVKGAFSFTVAGARAAPPRGRAR